MFLIHWRTKGKWRDVAPAKGMIPLRSLAHRIPVNIIAEKLLAFTVIPLSGVFCSITCNGTLQRGNKAYWIEALLRH